MLFRIISIFSFLIFLFGLNACNIQKGQSTTDENNPFKNINAEYVGDASCATCHDELYQSYQSHGMAQSFYALTAKTAVEDFGAAPVKDVNSRFEYRAYQENGKYFQEEYQMEGGEKVHQLVREMKFVVGSGTAARTYLTEENGRYYELPLTWYTQAKKWAFSPGYADYNQRFNRLIPSRCIACHNSFPQEEKDVLGKFTKMPMGIGCERCHGPGSLHAEERLDNPDVKGVDYTIVNPKHLPLERRLDVCQQCHLHGAVSLLKDGKEAFGFRPSQVLAAHVVLYQDASQEKQGQIAVISHADRMRQSACFKATEKTSKPMDCVTCHNPHEGFRDKGATYFNQSCLKCHATDALLTKVAPAAKNDHQATANCISCHLPKAEADDAPHSSFTDHFIRVVKEDRIKFSETPKGDPNLVSYFKTQDEHASIYEGMAYITFGRQNNNPKAVGNGIAKLTAALSNIEGFADAKYMLGLALLQEGRAAESITWLEKAVALKGNQSDWLNSLAQGYEANGNEPNKTEALYRKALSLQPKAANIRTNLGRFLEAQQRGGEALALYQEAVQEDPFLEEAHYNLGTLLIRQGKGAEGEQALKKALSLNPNHVKTQLNLAVLWAQQGNDEAAKRMLQRALRIEPNHVEVLQNLATFYVKKNQLAEATPLLEKVIQISPNNGQALGLLSGIYFNTGKTQQAKQMAQRALQLDPNNPMARQVMAQ